MDSKYKEFEFPELKDIKNLEYHRVYLKLKLASIRKCSKKVIPKLKKIFK